MIQISPQQRIWINIKVLCMALAIPVYDVLPSASAKYPFIHIGESFNQANRIHKDHLNGQTQVTVHVWHNDSRKRGDLTRIMGEIERTIRTTYRADVQAINTQVLIDNSTESNLLHGILDVEIKY